jgi:ribosome biogenesis GTPase
MSKRKLTRKQQWRIQKIQEERQKRAEKKAARLISQIDDEVLEDEIHFGLITANFGTEAEIETENGEVFRTLIRANLPSLVVGDKVVWQASKQGLGVITAVTERKTVLSRPNDRGQLKPVAANIDQMLVVFAPAPNYSSLLIDQYLAASEITGIEAVIVLNKIDRIGEEEHQEFEHLISRYQKLGYKIIQTSIFKPETINEIEQQLQNKSSVFVGQSGVGKSSIVKKMIGDHTIATTPLSEKSGLGQHTTSTSRLYHIQPSGSIIDSPGVREFRIWSMTRNELLEGFREFRNYLGKCRFRNCLHFNEPECALLKAVEDGGIDEVRLYNYHHIAESICIE